MLSKEELLTKDISELENIAQSLGVTNEFDDDKEGLIYAILDRQADRGAAEQAAPLKRKRVRIAKKDTDRVYTVNGREGENFDVKKNKIKNEAPSLFKDLPAGLPEEEEEPAAEEEPIMLNEQNWDNMTPEEIMASIPKHRGRKSKAEQEAIARAEAYIQAREQRAAQQRLGNLQHGLQDAQHQRNVRRAGQRLRHGHSNAECNERRSVVDGDNTEQRFGNGPFGPVLLDDHNGGCRRGSRRNSAQHQ